MDYQEFLEHLKKCVTDFMGEDFHISVSQVTKNNGIELTGLVIMEKGHNVSPTIYMEPFYQAYLKGVSIADLVKEIVKIYETNALLDQVNIEFFEDFQNVKTKILYKLINYEKNETFLKSVPYRRFLDMAVVCYCLVMSEEIHTATIPIENDHLKIWGITEDELFEYAEENTSRILRPEITNIKAVMHEILQEDVMKLMQDLNLDVEHGFSGEERSIREFASSLEKTMDVWSPNEMYILTNHMRFNGAACMRYSGVLREFARKLNVNVYIVPSSIHELILLPVGDLFDQEEFEQLVENVSHESDIQQDFLSNNVYYYDVQKDEIEKYN